MRKVIIISTLLLLVLGVYLGRGFLPSDQIKQDILLQYVGSIYEMQTRLDEAIQHYDNGDESAFTSQLNLASHYARHSNHLISDWLIGENFETPIIMVRYNAEVMNGAELAIRNEITEKDIEALRELNDNVTELIGNIGTVSELSDKYTPASKLLDKIISSFKEIYDNN